MYVKTSGLLRLSEGRSIQYIGARTPLPVPVVIDNFEYGELTYLVTSRLPGHPLLESYSLITSEVEAKLSTQLSRILAPLRALPSPLSSSQVCGFGGGPVYCTRIHFDASPAGSWLSVEDFHKDLMLRTGGLTYNLPEDRSQTEAIHDVIQRAHSRPHRICLTHNDLGPHSVLVDDEWNITGIIDWEACAWMPEYWELTKGTYLPQFRKGKWNRIMSAVFSMYALEQEAETYIWKHRQCYA